MEINEKIMTKEEKELVVKDLCGRLPYGVVVHFEGWNPEKLTQIDLRELVFNDMGGIPKPYLRPMSSMTEEERKEYNDLYYQVPIQRSDGNAYRDTKMVEALHIDWLNKNMFDYRGLIQKGLANAALEGMYNS